MSKLKEIKAVVQKVILKGNHGPFAVATSEDIDGSITFSLEPTVWQEDEQPEQGMIVILSELRKKRAGWRAKKGRFLNPSDEQTEIRNQERSNEMKGKVQDLITRERIDDALTLAKREGVKSLDKDFIQGILYTEKEDDFHEEMGRKIKLAEAFGFKIPDDVIQKEYSKLLDAPNRHWGGCIPETIKLIEKTGVLPSEDLVLARYEQELLDAWQNDFGIGYLNNLKKITGVPIKLKEEVIQEVFRRVISRGDVKLLTKKEKILGRKWKRNDSIWDVKVAVQEGYINIFRNEHFEIKNVLALRRKTGTPPTKETINKMYADVIDDSLHHTKCCGDLMGANQVVRLTRHFKPSKCPEVVAKKVEELFFYRSPDTRLFFRSEVFQECFHGLKLKRNSELRNKIEKRCQEIADKFTYADEAIHYLHAVKECLGFIPSISPESMTKMRQVLKDKDQYQLLEKLNVVFPE